MARKTRACTPVSLSFVDPPIKPILSRGHVGHTCAPLLSFSGTFHASLIRVGAKRHLSE